ncbi:MAG: hypothetical protein V1750_01405 [Acidobacteriota bacterium]
MPQAFLDQARLKDTIERLALRIEERFPGSGLGGVARRLDGVAGDTVRIVDDISRPFWVLRALVSLVVLALLAVLGYGVSRLPLAPGRLTLGDLVQMTESAVSELALIGAALVFLVSIETRGKRRRVIVAINTLRSIAHVIDMHQLTKDPHVLAEGQPPTLHSPRRVLSVFELGRYLDYCSELLSLTSKVGFLYVQRFNDPVSVEAVNELEDLCSGLSRKIWQKIMMLQDLPAPGPA